MTTTTQYTTGGQIGYYINEVAPTSTNLQTIINDNSVADIYAAEVAAGKDITILAEYPASTLLTTSINGSSVAQIYTAEVAAGKDITILGQYPTATILSNAITNSTATQIKNELIAQTKDDDVIQVFTTAQLYADMSTGQKNAMPNLQSTAELNLLTDAKKIQLITDASSADVISGTNANAALSTIQLGVCPLFSEVFTFPVAPTSTTYNQDSISWVSKGYASIKTETKVNCATATYKVNGSTQTVPFSFTEGDTVTINITRSAAGTLSTVTLTGLCAAFTVPEDGINALSSQTGRYIYWVDYTGQKINIIDTNTDTFGTAVNLPGGTNCTSCVFVTGVGGITNSLLVLGDNIVYLYSLATASAPALVGSYATTAGTGVVNATYDYLNNLVHFTSAASGGYATISKYNAANNTTTTLSNVLALDGGLSFVAGANAVMNAGYRKATSGTVQLYDPNKNYNPILGNDYTIASSRGGGDAFYSQKYGKMYVCGYQQVKAYTIADGLSAPTNVSCTSAVRGTVVANPSLDKLYLADRTGGTGIGIYNMSTDATITNTLATGGNVVGMVYSPAANAVYVFMEGTLQVKKIDGTTNTLTSPAGLTPLTNLPTANGGYKTACTNYQQF